MKSVVISGSTKFYKEIENFERELNLLGVKVFSFRNFKAKLSELQEEEVKELCVLGLVHEHFHKIQMADIIYVYNPDGYIGNSATLEMGYAAALKKPIYAFSGEDKELGRKLLIQKVCETPEELVKEFL